MDRKSALPRYKATQVGSLRLNYEDVQLIGSLTATFQSGFLPGGVCRTHHLREGSNRRACRRCEVSPFLLREVVVDDKLEVRGPVGGYST
jgi:hypothetical protein